MAKAFVPLALTANDLVEGDAVWWTGAGWSRELRDALVAGDEAAKAALEAAAARPGLGLEVVGAYLVELGQDRRPLLRREAIRAEREPTFAYGADAPLRRAA